MNHAHSTHLQPIARSGHQARAARLGGDETTGASSTCNTRTCACATSQPISVRFDGGTERHGNSIFIFEVANLCVAHLGHLHHTLTQQQLNEIGRVDIVLVPVDGVLYARSRWHGRSTACPQGAADDPHALFQCVHARSLSAARTPRMGRGRRGNTIAGGIQDESPGKAEDTGAAGPLTAAVTRPSRYKWVDCDKRQIAALIAYLSTEAVDGSEPMFSCRVLGARFCKISRDLHGADLE